MERNERYCLRPPAVALLWRTDHRVPMLIREEDLHEAVVVDLSLEVRDGLRHHVVDLVRVRARVRVRVRTRVRLRVRVQVRAQDSLP